MTIMCTVLLTYYIKLSFKVEDISGSFFLSPTILYFQVFHFVVFHFYEKRSFHFLVSVRLVSTRSILSLENWSKPVHFYHYLSRRLWLCPVNQLKHYHKVGNIIHLCCQRNHTNCIIRSLRYIMTLSMTKGRTLWNVWIWNDSEIFINHQDFNLRSKFNFWPIIWLIF